MTTLQFTIRQKLIFSFVFAVVFSTALVSFISLRQAHQVIEKRILNSELPAILMQFNNAIDKEISGLLAAAKQLAESKLLIKQVAALRSADQDSAVLSELRAVKQQYSLIDASVANRISGKYWMDSYTTAGQHKPQGWFRTLVNGGKETALSIYREDNGDVKLFINYQQPDGVILSGLSKSMTSMVSFINQFTLEQTGFIYLVDNQGRIRLHKGKEDVRDASLQNEYSAEVSQQLLKKSDFNVVKIDVDGKPLIVASSYIPSMNWFVVAELPENEAFTELQKITQTIMVWTIAIALVFVLLAVVIAGNITRPISRLAAVFKDLGEGDGDLRHRITIEGQDEMAQLSEGFNSFISKIHHSVKEVAETGNSLREAAEAVAQQAELTLDNSHSQRDRTLQVATAINQMGATVNEIARNAVKAAETTHNAENETRSGQEVVGQTRSTINQLADDATEVSAVIDSLANNTLAIGSILDVIRGISDQTNLLALNAAIEAARAGEQGRGFAVVADEVRSLASRTANSTNEIQTMINQLQQEASNAVNAIVTSRELTADGVESTIKASNALAAIADRISLIAEMNSQVATATEEQSSVVSDINCNIEEISETTQRSAETAGDLAQSSQSLRELSQRLDNMVGTFKL